MTGSALVTITALVNPNVKIEIQGFAVIGSKSACHFGSKDSCHYHFRGPHSS
jgi:hypothetical protein